MIETVVEITMRVGLWNGIDAAMDNKANNARWEYWNGGGEMGDPADPRSARSRDAPPRSVRRAGARSTTPGCGLPTSRSLSRSHVSGGSSSSPTPTTACPSTRSWPGARQADLEATCTTRPTCAERRSWLSVARWPTGYPSTRCRWRERRRGGLLPSCRDEGKVFGELHEIVGQVGLHDSADR